MAPDSLRISVIIPIYNVTAFLAEALSSVEVQDYAEKEVIVVDDGSHPAAADEIMAACDECPDATLLRHERNAGQAIARETGLQHCTGDLIVFLDADDMLAEGSLRFFADFMERHPHLIACYAQQQKVDAHGAPMDEPPAPPASDMLSGKALLEKLLRHESVIRNGGTVCIRRRLLEQVPLEHQHLRLGEDWVMWCRLALAGEVAPAGERVVLLRRRHGGNISSVLSLENPSLVFRTIDTVYGDPQFRAFMGEARMDELHLLVTNRMHAYFAKAYAELSRTEEARFHMSQLRKPPQEDTPVHVRKMLDSD